GAAAGPAAEVAAHSERQRTDGAVTIWRAGRALPRLRAAAVETAAARGRRRCGDQDRQARSAEGGAQRSLSLREREKVQEMPRCRCLRPTNPVGLFCI